MEIEIKTFNQLDTSTLYDILQLRSSVFVVEQDCVYQDIDSKDKQALHVILKVEGNLVAYTRCFAPGLYFKEASIGRVVVVSQHRKNKYGHQIIERSIQEISKNYKTEKIKISAQKHLKKFYENHGFYKIGKQYLEDGIPHISMVNYKL